MVLTHSDGTITTTVVEQDLFNITTGGPRHYATWIFTHNMVLGDIITLRVYVEDENSTTQRKYLEVALQDSQTDPAFFVPFIPANEYRVSIQRTGGTDRVYNWIRAQTS